MGISLISYNPFSANLRGGIFTTSGDGVETVFTIPHGAVNMPTSFSVEPQTDDAKAAHMVSIDSTNITITYDVAPPEGDLVFVWMVV